MQPQTNARNRHGDTNGLKAGKAGGLFSSDSRISFGQKAFGSVQKWTKLRTVI